MIINDKPVMMEDTQAVKGYMGRTVGRVWKDIYQYSGGVFNILKGYAFMEHEYEIFKDLRWIEITVGHKVVKHLPVSEVLQIGRWRPTLWKRRFIVDPDVWIMGSRVPNADREPPGDPDVGDLHTVESSPVLNAPKSVGA